MGMLGSEPKKQNLQPQHAHMAQVISLSFYLNTVVLFLGGLGDPAATCKGFQKRS